MSSFWYSLVITVSVCGTDSAVLLHVRMVHHPCQRQTFQRYVQLCVFSMIVPFQMVMFTLAKTADTLKLNNPYNICIIYLGFGAGLAVFMFTGFMKIHADCY